ncbi:MAG: ATP-binding cassette domain-containing protein [Vulcanimicrobiota bacterium]
MMVEADQVHHFYGSGKLRRQVLHQVSLKLDAGQIVILSGPSGCGKTTLLTLVGGLSSLQQGRLTVLGQPLPILEPETCGPHLVGRLFFEQARIQPGLLTPPGESGDFGWFLDGQCKLIATYLSS